MRGIVSFSTFPIVLWFCFILLFPCVPHPSHWLGMFILCHDVLQVCNLTFLALWSLWLSGISWHLSRDLGHLKSIVTLETVNSNLDWVQFLHYQMTMSLWRTEAKCYGLDLECSPRAQSAQFPACDVCVFVFVLKAAEPDRRRSLVQAFECYVGLWFPPVFASSCLLPCEWVSDTYPYRWLELPSSP